jgi:hypothetical protein
MMSKLQKILGTTILKTIGFIFISLVVLAAFSEIPSPLLLIVAIPAMAGRIIYKHFGGTRCIHCNSRVSSTVRRYRNSAADICDTCQMWQCFIMPNEQERTRQESAVGAKEAKAKVKATAGEKARARAKERARRQEQGQGAQTDQKSQKTKPERVFDPYEVLGLIRGASQEEIKTAYHKLMKVYHPDMVAHLGADVQKIAAEKALVINRAYEIIGN